MTDNKDKKVLNVPALRFPEFTREWKETTLDNECTINPTSDKLKSEFVYVDLESVERGELTKRQVIEKENAPSRAQRVLQNEDILFQCVRPYQKNNYIVKEVSSEIQWVASTGYAQLRTDRNIPAFIYHLLNTSSFNKKVIVRCTGSSYPAINSYDLSKIHFYICGIDEQKRIADFLSLLDERIATQNKIIEKYESLIQAIRQVALQPHGDWEEFKLCELADIKSGYSGNQVSGKTKYAVSRIETISKHHIDMSRVGYVQDIPSEYKLSIGDILFSNINSVQYIGNTAFVDKEYDLYHGMNLLRIIPNISLVMPRFLHLLLCTNRAIRHFQTICNKAVSQASINQTSLGKTIFHIPPLSFQKRICNIFECIEQRLNLEVDYYKMLRLQKTFLLHEMFM